MSMSSSPQSLSSTSPSSLAESTSAGRLSGTSPTTSTSPSTGQVAGDLVSRSINISDGACAEDPEDYTLLRHLPNWKTLLTPQPARTELRDSEYFDAFLPGLVVRGGRWVWLEEGTGVAVLPSNEGKTGDAVGRAAILDTDRLPNGIKHNNSPRGAEAPPAANGLGATASPFRVRLTPYAVASVKSQNGSLAPTPSSTQGPGDQSTRANPAPAPLPADTFVHIGQRVLSPAETQFPQGPWPGQAVQWLPLPPAEWPGFDGRWFPYRAARFYLARGFWYHACNGWWILQQAPPMPGLGLGPGPVTAPAAAGGVKDRKAHLDMDAHDPFNPFLRAGEVEAERHYGFGSAHAPRFWRGAPLSDEDALAGREQHAMEAAHRAWWTKENVDRAARDRRYAEVARRMGEEQERVRQLERERVGREADRVAQRLQDEEAARCRQASLQFARGRGGRPGRGRF